MKNMAYLFSLRSAPDTHIIAFSSDLSVYRFSVPFAKDEWQHIATIEITPAILRRYAHNPADVIQALATFGHYMVLTTSIERSKRRNNDMPNIAHLF